MTTKLLPKKSYNLNSRYSNINSLPKIGSSSIKNISRKKPILFQSSSLPDFYTRNYDKYLEKINQRNKRTSKLISEQELNNILYTLKKFYSDVIDINRKKNEKITYLKKTLNYEEDKLNQLKEFQDIELPDEKISVKNFNELKVSKTQVEKQLKNLLKEKQNLDDLIKNESEYFRTIEYMCEEENNRFKEIKQETNIIEERINNVAHYQKMIDNNINKEKIKNNEEKIIEDKLKKGKELLDLISLNQKIKNENIDKMILNKEKGVEELKDKLLEIKRQNKIDNIEYQNDIKNKIERAKEFYEFQKIKEKNIIEIVYCLFLIENYIIYEEHFDKKKIMNSKEYKILSNNKILRDNNKEQGIHISKINIIKNQEASPIIGNIKIQEDKSDNINKIDPKTNKDEKEESIKRDEDEKDQVRDSGIFITNLKKKLTLKDEQLNALKLEKESKENEIENKTSYSTKNKKSNFLNFMSNKEIKKVHFENNKKENISFNNIDIVDTNKIETSKVDNKIEVKENNNLEENFPLNDKNITDNLFEELKEKLSNIKITKKILFDYNSKLTSKSNSIKNLSNKLHKKEIELQDKRLLYFEKVISVIQENFTIFKQLMKLNPEINKFIQKNKEFIYGIKTKNKKEKIKELNKRLNPIYDTELNNQDNNKYEIDTKINDNLELLTKSLNKIIISTKDFFFKCNDYFGQIKEIVENIYNSEKNHIEKREKKGNKNEDNIKYENYKMIGDIMKVISDEDNQLNELIKKIEIKIIDNKENFINYLKSLINYSQINEELKKIFDIKELNKDLLYIFYKDNNEESKKIKKLYYKQFKLKGLPQLETEFYFLNNYENSLEQIKKIKKIVDNIENDEKLLNYISRKTSKMRKKTKEIIRLSSINSTTNKNINFRDTQKNNNILDGFNTISHSSQKDTLYSELEFMTKGKIDEDDILDNNTKKRLTKIKKRRTNSIEESVVNKLYSPFLHKTEYLRKLNKNMKGIKSLSTLNCQTNYILRKRKDEVDNTTNQMYIYNNSLINHDKLSIQTYNSLVNAAMEIQNEYKYDKNFLNSKLIYS